MFSLNMHRHTLIMRIHGYVALERELGAACVVLAAGERWQKTRKEEG